MGAEIAALDHGKRGKDVLKLIMYAGSLCGIVGGIGVIGAE